VETVDPRESLKIKGSRAWVHVVLEVVDPREGLIFLGFRAWVFYGIWRLLFILFKEGQKRRGRRPCPALKRLAVKLGC